jgi:hypothetical protein
MTTAREARPAQVLLFTGHRLDAPGRPIPRFPASAEGRAHEMIATAISSELSAAVGPVAGLAGGASGSDILFHEIAARLAVPTELYLALPPADYRAASVADGGEAWAARFDALCEDLPIHLLPDAARRDDPALSVWERSNLWMLDSALAWTTGGTTLLALWNGEGGDGPGGTADMVARAHAGGARVVRLDARRLLEVEAT